MTYSPELLAAVGVLDQDRPGWWRKVDLGTLNMSSCASCVIGQVFGLGPVARYVSGSYASILFPLTDKYRLSPEVFTDTRDNHYGDQWRSFIAERQSADSIGSSLSIPDPREDEVEGQYGERVRV